MSQKMLVILIFCFMSAVAPLKIYNFSGLEEQISKVKADFAQINGFDASSDSETLIYDINNDGHSEIIILGYEDNDNLEGAVAVYTKSGTRLLNEKFTDRKFGAYEISKIKNNTYGNMLAIYCIPRARGEFVTRVYVFNSNKLQKLEELSSSSQGITVTDTDKDGNDELNGTEYYDHRESRINVGYKEVYDRLVYKWDETKKKYIKYIYGQDGIRDDLRKNIGTITKNEVVEILNKGYKKLKSFKGSVNISDFKKEMENIMTYNLIYKFENADDLEKVDTDLISLPKIDPQKIVLTFSNNNNDLTVGQVITKVEGKQKYEITVGIYLIKTKYGWKINDVISFDE